jgi:hypothetical protein
MSISFALTQRWVRVFGVPAVDEGVFNPGGEALVVSGVKGLLVEACDCCVLIEIDVVAVEVMAVLHDKFVELECH